MHLYYGRDERMILQTNDRSKLCHSFVPRDRPYFKRLLLPQDLLIHSVRTTVHISVAIPAK